jgi:hypothetical protein
VRFREAQEEEARAQEATAREELERELLQKRRELAEFKYELAWRRLCRKYGYTPNEKLDRKWDGQPRDDLGRFDFGKKPDEQPDAADNSGRTDPLVVSDVEETVSGEEFAQGRRIGTARVRIGDRIVEVEGGQAARLVEAQARADSAITRVREIDPDWRPTPSLKETVEGTIRAYESEAEEAQARAGELAKKGIGPGPFAGESVSARGPERNFTSREHEEINRIGEETGCHTCGTKNPGTTSGNFVVDHQLPTALNSLGRAQQLYPQCLTCSLRQGGWISGRRIGR